MVAIKHRYTDFGKNYIQVVKYSIAYKDVFSFKDLFMIMREWLIENGYATRENEKFPEVFYLQKTSRTQEKEIQIMWRANRNPKPEAELWRFDMDIDISVTGLKDVELVVKGQKIRAQKGGLRIEVITHLAIDYKKEMQKKPHLRLLRFLTKRKFKETQTILEKQLYDDAYSLQDEIKTYLKLESFQPERFGKEFLPKKLPE